VVSATVPTAAATLPAVQVPPAPSRPAAGDADQSSSDDDDYDESHEEQFDGSVSQTAAVASAAAGSDPAAKMHPGRIGAAPNGIGRTDGQSIVWSSTVHADATRQTGYTWDTFRLGWRDPLDKIFRTLGNDSCKWTCCGGQWDAVGCQAAPAATPAPPPPPAKAAPKTKRAANNATNSASLSCVLFLCTHYRFGTFSGGQCRQPKAVSSFFLIPILVFLL
jgi:hypothetical protein